VISIVTLVLADQDAEVVRSEQWLELAFWHALAATA
jgi:hypothetical protein